MTESDITEEEFVKFVKAQATAANKLNYKEVAKAAGLSETTAERISVTFDGLKNKFSKAYLDATIKTKPVVGKAKEAPKVEKRPLKK